jgi:hypothetical protein
MPVAGSDVSITGPIGGVHRGCRALSNSCGGDNPRMGNARYASCSRGWGIPPGHRACGEFDTAQAHRRHAGCGVRSKTKVHFRRCACTATWRRQPQEGRGSWLGYCARGTCRLLEDRSGIRQRQDLKVASCPSQILRLPSRGRLLLALLECACTDLSKPAVSCPSCAKVGSGAIPSHRCPVPSPHYSIQQRYKDSYPGKRWTSKRGNASASSDSTTLTKRK